MIESNTYALIAGACGIGSAFPKSDDWLDWPGLGSKFSMIIESLNPSGSGASCTAPRFSAW